MSGKLSGKLCCARRRLHDDMAHRVAPTTLRLYSKDFASLVLFVESQVPQEQFSSEAEELYFHIANFRDEMQLSRGLHGRLVAAVEFFCPEFKTKLIRARESLKGRLIHDPIKHTMPTTRRLAVGFGVKFAEFGRPRMGAAHIVQTESGLRASELLGIQEEHVDATDATTPITIALGLKTSTKAKRLQAVIIRYEKHPTSHLLLRMLKATTPRGRKIFPYSYAQYNGGVQLIDRHLHLNLGLSGHSGRAAFATEGLIAGDEVRTIMKDGRWMTGSAFRVYVDIVGALRVQAQVQSEGLSPLLSYACQQLYLFLNPATFVGEVHGRYKEKATFFLNRSTTAGVLSGRSKEAEEQVSHPAPSTGAGGRGSQSLAAATTGPHVDERGGQKAAGVAATSVNSSILQRSSGSSSEPGAGQPAGKGKGKCKGKLIRAR